MVTFYRQHFLIPFFKFFQKEFRISFIEVYFHMNMKPTIKNFNECATIVYILWRFYMKIYNAKYLDNNQRFIVAIITGLIAAIILGTLYGLITSFLHIEFSVMFVAVGYGIAATIKHFGRGVHTRFMVVGAIMTFLAIFIGDLVSAISLNGVAVLFTSGNLPVIATTFLSYLRSFASSNPFTLISLAFRLIGIYVGYTQSVIL